MHLPHRSIFYFVWHSHCMMVNRFRFEGLVFDTLNLLHHLAVLGRMQGCVVCSSVMHG